MLTGRSDLPANLRRLQAHAHSRGEASGRFSCPRPEASFVSLFTHPRDISERAERKGLDDFITWLLEDQTMHSG